MYIENFSLFYTPSPLLHCFSLLLKPYFPTKHFLLSRIVIVVTHWVGYLNEHEWEVIYWSVDNWSVGSPTKEKYTPFLPANYNFQWILGEHWSLIAPPPSMTMCWRAQSVPALFVTCNYSMSTTVLSYLTDVYLVSPILWLIILSTLSSVMLPVPWRERHKCPLWAFLHHLHFDTLTSNELHINH